MSLAAGPGRGGGAEKQLPEELSLVVDKHVAYIQSLDTVRSASAEQVRALALTLTNSGEMSWSITLPSTCASAASTGA